MVDDEDDELNRQNLNRRRSRSASVFNLDKRRSSKPFINNKRMLQIKTNETLNENEDEDDKSTHSNQEIESLSENLEIKF